MNNIQILILAEKNSWENISVPEEVVLEHRTVINELPKKAYELVILDRTPTPQECDILHQATKAHTLFVTENVDVHACQQLFHCKMGQQLKSQDVASFLQTESQWFFPDSYGEKFHMDSIAISRIFSGTVGWNGNYALSLEGFFGEELSQIAYWRNNIPIQAGQTLDFWL